MQFNPLLQLDPNGALQTTRDGGGAGFMILGESNQDVVVLSADLPESTRVLQFGEKYPHRFFNVGVAEQNMAGVAAGLALAGKIPFITSFAVFSPGRNWDQIRVSIAYSKANVKILAAEAGLSVGEDGASHQGMEDVAIMRTLPNMTVLAPADFEEAKKAIVASAAWPGPVYIRYCKTKSPTYTTTSTPFHIGRAYTYVEGSDVTILNTGLTIPFAIEAVAKLEEEGIHAELVHVPTVKPLDTETILSSVRKTGCVVSIEDHQIAGGFGSAVLEDISESVAIPFEFVGMHDSFGESGDAALLLKKYSISTEMLVEKAKKAISRKVS